MYMSQHTMCVVLLRKCLPLAATHEIAHALERRNMQTENHKHTIIIIIIIIIITIIIIIITIKMFVTNHHNDVHQKFSKERSRNSLRWSQEKHSVPHLDCTRIS